MESEKIASPTERYEKRIAFFSEQAKTFEARSRRYSNLRLPPSQASARPSSQLSNTI